VSNFFTFDIIDDPGLARSRHLGAIVKI